MNEASITVAIPFRGQWSMLRCAVESVLAQTTSQWHLVVCDNASGDASVESQLRAYGDERIRYIDNEEDLGIVGNFNRCLDAAETDLATLLHCDDRLAPGYCAAMICAFENRSDAVAHYCRPQSIDERGRPCFSTREFVKRFFEPRREEGVVVLRGEPGAAAILRGNFICGPAICFRKSALGERRFDPAWGQVMDIELHVRLLMDGETIVGLPAALYCYRRHHGQTTARNIQDLSFFDEHFRLYDVLQAQAEQMGWRGLARVARRKRVVTLQLLYWALADLTKADFRYALQKGRLLFGGSSTLGNARANEADVETYTENAN
jgi:glycosyltransferase involved in cell wall biosynthesis